MPWIPGIGFTKSNYAFLSFPSLPPIEIAVDCSLSMGDPVAFVRFTPLDLFVIDWTFGAIDARVSGFLTRSRSTADEDLVKELCFWSGKNLWCTIRSGVISQVISTLLGRETTTLTRASSRTFSTARSERPRSAERATWRGPRSGTEATNREGATGG
ncbi:uncharacterized protein LOC143188348 [Calliopsis andreniformis]|uniref:uncharacterized protein LOC143188348 n=1 Tax=Calliopsis andreniformis TaxID=337506 RepID=UPI003FCECCAB